MPLTDQARRLVDASNIAFLATLDAEGAPHVSPVWIDRDGNTHVELNQDNNGDQDEADRASANWTMTLSGLNETVDKG